MLCFITVGKVKFNNEARKANHNEAMHNMHHPLLDETLYNWPLNLHENTGPLLDSIIYMGCSVDTIAVTATFIVSHLLSPVGLVHWGQGAEQLLLHEHMGNYVAEPINKLWQKECFWILHKLFISLASVRISKLASIFFKNPGRSFMLKLNFRWHFPAYSGISGWKRGNDPYTNAPV